MFVNNKEKEDKLCCSIIKVEREFHFFILCSHYTLSSTTFKMTFKLKVKNQFRTGHTMQTQCCTSCCVFWSTSMKYLLLLNFLAVFQHFHFEPIWYLVRMTYKEKKSIIFNLQRRHSLEPNGLNLEHLFICISTAGVKQI